MMTSKRLRHRIAPMLPLLAGLVAFGAALLGSGRASAQWVSGCTVTNVMSHEGGCFRVIFTGCTTNPVGWTEFFMLRVNDSAQQAQSLALAALLSGRKIGFYADGVKSNICFGTRPVGAYVNIAN